MDYPSGFREKRKPVAGSTAPAESIGDENERVPFRSTRSSDRRAKSVGARPRTGISAGHHDPTHGPAPPLPPLPLRIPNQHTTGLQADSTTTLSAGEKPRLARVASAATINVPPPQGETSSPFTDTAPVAHPSPRLSPPPPFHPPPYSATLPIPSPHAASDQGPPAPPSHSQTALAAARDFASRFKPLSTCSGKHHTVLLHSAPLVPYRGPSTSVSLTVLADAALPPPPRRTLWLQRRGFSGDAGARLKALVGATADWLDVTPASRVDLADLDDPARERGWARDLGRLGARLERLGLGAHVPRETHVVRIPAAAEDGYFRVVVCSSSGSGSGEDGGGGGGKRKVLCSSPVFRILSTSADVSVFRGASLKTLPLEVGVKVASVIATNTATRVVAPVVGRVQDGVQRLQSTSVGQRVQTASMVANKAGLGDHLAGMEERYTQERNNQIFGVDGVVMDQADVVGPDDGPTEPFPLRFQGKVVRGTGLGNERLGTPTANLSGVPEHIKSRMRGVYFGWARVVPSADGKPLMDMPPDWQAAIITVGPSPHASASVIAKTVIAVHMIYDFGERTFYDEGVQVLAMAYLRPISAPGTTVDEMQDALSQDVWLTMASLSRENWDWHVALDRVEAAKATQTLSDRYLGVRERVQTRVDSIPLHWAGVRTAQAEARDLSYGKGGYWIAR